MSSMHFNSSYEKKINLYHKEVDQIKSSNLST